MKQWKRICALVMSVLTMAPTVMGAVGCKDKGESSSSEKHSHNWTTAVTKEATCTEKGVKTKTCSVCGETETEEIEAGHSIVKYGAQAATCVTSGWAAYEECEKCGYTTKQVNPALGHNYEGDTCTRCGGDIADCTHTWGGWTTVTEKTCSEAGLKMRTCTSCQAEELASIPARHTLVQGQGRAPLCVNSGWTGGLYCEKCDYDEREYLPAMGHNYVNGSCVNPGCNQVPSGGNDQVDVTKANLSVATYDGGVGKAWLEDAIARFEELYATATHFQEGRVGVKISLDGNKNKYGGNKLLESVMNKDVYFTEAVDYYGFVNQGTVADLTDVVTGSMAAYGERGTIEDKLDPTAKAFMTAKDGKYYMIPFYDGFYGLIYDVELFEEEGFYFDKDGDFTSDKTEFANGPDGKPNTYDDGLPATYDQMIKLCDRIVQKGYTPFMYSGNYPAYVNRAFVSYAADYEGYDAFSLNQTFNGKAKLAKSITPGEGTMEATIEFEEVDISEANGYELQRQAGKYYALAMEEALFGSTKYIGGRFNGLDYTVAQANFIKGKYGRDATKRYAMLAEGVWWENESAATFAEVETIFQENKMSRKFGFMPVPKVNAAAVGEQTMYSANSSYGFINKECKNMELAKEFMKFLHTDLEMSKFTAKTSIPRSLDYEVMEHDRAIASYFGKTLIDMRANAKVVYPYSATDLAIQNPVNFENDTWFGVATVGQVRNNAFNAFKDGKATALQYFNGLYAYQQGVWNGLKR